MTRHWKIIVWLCRDHITTNKSYYAREACTFHYSTSNNEDECLLVYLLTRWVVKRQKKVNDACIVQHAKRHHACS